MCLINKLKINKTVSEKTKFCGNGFIDCYLVWLYNKNKLREINQKEDEK